MAGLYRPTYSDKCPRTGRRIKKQTKKWYGWYKDRDGRTVRVPLSEDKAVAQQMLAKLIANAERGRAGLVDAFAEHRNRPIREHVEDYRTDLRNREVSAAQVQMVCSRILRVVELSDLKSIADVSPAKVQAAIAHLRQQENRSIQTCNFYLQGMKQFCRWLVREQRLESSPIAYMQRGNVRLDRRHDRRDLSPEEVAALLAAARSGPDMRGLRGPDRALLYSMALYTGLRASELASLTTDSLLLDGETPAVVVAAAYSKHRREDRVPLHPDIVAQLREWVASKARDSRLWPGRWAKGKEAGVMLKADLERAGVPYKTEAGYADFHALRHSFISNLVRSGANPRVAMALARHSTIELTMNRYAHVLPSETVRALAALPALPKQEQAGSEKEPAA
jgi:integrase